MFVFYHSHKPLPIVQGFSSSDECCASQYLWNLITGLSLCFNYGVCSINTRPIATPSHLSSVFRMKKYLFVCACVCLVCVFVCVWCVVRAYVWACVCVFGACLCVCVCGVFVHVLLWCMFMRVHACVVCLCVCCVFVWSACACLCVHVPAVCVRSCACV